MKNDSNIPRQTKRKTFAWIIASLVVVCVLVMIFAKATDHRRELLNTLARNDNVHLEALLKAHPNLANADLPGRASKQTWQPLHAAACFGSPETIEILIRHHAQVNAKDSTGLTPLHYTIPLSRYDSAAILINKGADVNLKGRDGNSPLDLAKNLRDQRMVELLRIRGAKE